MYEVLIDIVDNDEAVRSAVLLLVMSFGCRGRAYASAQHFLASIKLDPHPDCLVVDLEMPGMNGAELLEALSVQQVRFPAVVVTSHGVSPLSVRARRAGAHAVLDKPFGDDEFKRTIDHALMSTRP